VLLMSSLGQVKRQVRLREISGIVEALAFSADDRSIVVQRGDVGVFGAAGGLQWTTMDSELAHARDLRTFVASWMPSHGPGFGRITALDEHGNALWTKLGAGGVISPTGHRIVARLDDDQNPKEEDAFRDEPKSTLTVLSRQ